MTTTEILLAIAIGGYIVLLARAVYNWLQN